MDISEILVTVGALLLLGLLTDVLGKRTALPRVTLLMLFGVAFGPSMADLLPHSSDKWFHLFADAALSMVGFLLGEKLTRERLASYGRSVLWISVAEVIVTSAAVFAGLLLLGAHWDVALLLASISTATAPAATLDVVREDGAEGPFTDTLLGIVAVDDAWGLIVFAFAVAICLGQSGDGASTFLVNTSRELLGAGALGLALGIPAAYVTGRIDPGEPTLSEALGVVFLCGGLALWLEVSFLLASMVLGAVVANLAKHHSRPFHEIENIEWPFMVLFFVFAGASLDPRSLLEIGAIGSIYVAMRVAGRIVGGWLGGQISGASPEIRRWMGLALMPQAGVALGMALIAAERFPQHADTILPVVIGATVLFEVVGPVLTRRAIAAASSPEAAR